MFCRTLLLVLLLFSCSRETQEPEESQGSPATAAAIPATFLDVELQWTAFVTPVERIDVDDPSRYTLTFLADGKVAIRADCNRGFGTYEVFEGRRLQFGPFGVTRAMCEPGSHSERYLRELERATTFFTQDDKLYLELPYDSGTLHFAQVP